MNIKFRQKAIITNSEGKLLVLHVTAESGIWDLPGGTTEFPELHEDAFRRELREELDSKLISFEPFFIHTRYSPASDNYHIVICYKTTTDSSPITLSSEHDELRWLTPQEILDLKTEPFLHELAKKLAQ